MIDLVSIANSISASSSRIKAFCMASAKVSVDHEARLLDHADRLDKLEAPAPVPDPVPTPDPDPVPVPEPTPDPIPAPPSGAPTGYYWKGDFTDAAPFSVFDTHEAWLDKTVIDPVFGTTAPMKLVTVPASPACPWSDKMVRIIVSNSLPSGSVTGATINLWRPGAYGPPWVEGNTVWCRTSFVIPDGTDAVWPGRLTPVGGDGVSSSWHVLMEWHKNDGAQAPGPTSTKLEIGWGGAGGPSLMFKPLGGLNGQLQGRYLYETDQVQGTANGAGGTTGPVAGNIVPLKFNHRYDVLFKWMLSPDPAKAWIDGWIDGQLRWSGAFPNMFQKADGTVPAISWQAGMYRNYRTYTVGGQTYNTQTTADNEHVYLGPMIDGPTPASVA